MVSNTVATDCSMRLSRASMRALFLLNWVIRLSTPWSDTRRLDSLEIPA